MKEHEKKILRIFGLYFVHPKTFHLDKGGTSTMKLSNFFKVRPWKFHRQDFSPGY